MAICTMQTASALGSHYEIVRESPCMELTTEYDRGQDDRFVAICITAKMPRSAARPLLFALCK
jgi:hypothetical protein